MILFYRLGSCLLPGSARLFFLFLLSCRYRLHRIFFIALIWSRASYTNCLIATTTIPHINSISAHHVLYSTFTCFTLPLLVLLDWTSAAFGKPYSLFRISVTTLDMSLTNTIAQPKRSGSLRSTVPVTTVSLHRQRCQ
jgi:hypothetical protein